MTALANRVELLKLAHVLDVDPGELAPLAPAPTEALRDLRHAIGESLFERHEARFRRIAKLAASVPAPLSARIAQMALTPLLGARVAAVMEPTLAVKLAQSLDVSYLADLSAVLDPLRAESIIARMPGDKVVEIGATLIDRKHYFALGRFVSVIEPDIAMRVVEHADGLDLLQVALFADDVEALDRLVSRCDDAQLGAAISAAHEHELYDDAVTLVVAVQASTRERLAPLIAGLPEAGIDAFARSIHRFDAWASILPTLNAVDDDTLSHIANAPALLDDGVLPQVLRVAAELGLDQVPHRLGRVLDDAHQRAAGQALTSS